MILQYLDEWLLLLLVNAIGMISPGPDFIICVRNSIMYSRRAGVFTALGFGAGVAVHIAYCLIGIATIISQSLLLFSIIKYIGAAYLLYIGYKALRSKGFSHKIDIKNEGASISDFAAFRSGFITNVFNPKVTMTFMAIFTQVVDPQTPLQVQLLYSVTCMVLTAGWFSMVALVLTHKTIRQRFLAFSQWIDRACGALLVALGIKLAVSKV